MQQDGEHEGAGEETQGGETDRVDGGVLLRRAAEQRIAGEGQHRQDSEQQGTAVGHRRVSAAQVGGEVDVAGAEDRLTRLCTLSLRRIAETCAFTVVSAMSRL